MYLLLAVYLFCHCGNKNIFSLLFSDWRRKWQPTAVFLPGESQGRGSLVGCRLRGRAGSDTTEVTQQQQHTLIIAGMQDANIIIIYYFLLDLLIECSYWRQ